MNRLTRNALGLTVILSWCVQGQISTGVSYQPTLLAVEHQERGKDFEELAPTAANTFEDARIRITWKPRPSQLEFTLTNKGGATLRVLWDEASYVGVDGKADRIMHQGVRFADRNASMPPTSVMRGSSLDDLIAPTGNVYWREGYATNDIGAWESRPLVATDATVTESSRVKVLLPLDIGGVVHEYVFIFSLTETAAPAQTKPKEIAIVRKREQVVNCKLLGDIAAHPPYILPGDDYRQLRRKAAALGADTILVPGRRIGAVEGFAYRCTEK